jgi:hypothetical protein
MANNFQLANAAADAVCALLDGGKLRIYGGAQPASADDAVGAQPLLAELTFGNPAFGAALAGAATANAITADASANDTDTATWFRALKSDNTKVFDGSVGLLGCDLNLNSVAIQVGAQVSVTSLTYTQPRA